MSETVSEQLVEQRVRNRIIEYLELAASAENQRTYECNVPIAVVPEEMIEHWSDLMNGAHIDDVLAEEWIVFSDAEKKAIRDFHSVWLATSEGTPMPMP